MLKDASTKAIGAILLLALLIRIVYLAKGVTLWWDSHIYVGMGKYIFSAGQLGIWETFRPLIHPIIIGFFWWIKINPLLIGTLLDVIFSLLATYLLYKLGAKTFSKEVGLLAAAILAMTPIFIIHTGLILTEPLTLVLTVCAMILLTKEKPRYEVIGIILAFAFLTKFTQAMVALSVGLLLLLEKKSLKQKMQNASVLTLGFFVPTTIFFIFNYLRYNDPFLPLTSGSAIVQTSTWLYNSAQTFYITDFFAPNPIYLFFIPAVYLVMYKNKEKKIIEKLMILVPLLFAVYFFTVARKEVRYIVTALPFLALAASYAIITLKEKVKHSPKPIIKSTAIIPLAAVLMFLALPGAFSLDHPETYESEFNAILEEKQISGTVLTTETFPYTYADTKVIPFSGVEFTRKTYEKHKESTQLLVINECNLPCDPQDDVCNEEKQSIMAKIRNETTIIWSSPEELCTLEIRER